MCYIRTTIFYILVCLWTIILAIPTFIFLFSPIFSGLLRRVMRFWCGGIIFILRYIFGLRYRLLGCEHIPSGSVIYASQHQSSWETFAFAYFLEDIVFVLKEELLRLPVIGSYMRATGMIAIERNLARKAIYRLSKSCRSTVAAGLSVVIFPEGTRMRVGQKVRLKRGVVLLYSKMSVPVVPVVLNSGLYWGKNGLISGRGEITLEFLPCIPSGLSNEVFLARLRQSLDNASERLVKK